MKWFLVLFLVLSVSCSKVNVAYDWAPRFLTNYLEDQFDFSSERYRQIKKAIQKDLEQNKVLVKTEILKNIDTVIEQIPQKEISAESLENFILQIQDSQMKLMRAFQPTFEQVLIGMNQAELDYFKKTLQKRWDKQDEHSKDETKFKKRLKERFVDTMETHFDDVTAGQKQIYDEYLIENFDRFKTPSQKRQVWLEQFESRFEAKPQLVEWVIKLYSNDPTIKSEEQLTQDRLALKQSQKLVQKIWKSLTDKQKTYLTETLTELKQELNQL